MQIHRRRMTALMLALCIFAGIAPISASAKEAPKPTESDVVAYAILGSEVQTYGMDVWMGIDPTIVSEEIRGKDAWVLDSSKGQNQGYINVNIHDDLFFNLSDGTNFEVEIEYFDNDRKGTLAFEYMEYIKRDTATAPLNWDTAKEALANTTTLGEILQWNGTQNWSSYTWLMQNPLMGNTVTGGCDFRIGTYSSEMKQSQGGKHYIHSIKVRKTGTKDVLNITPKMKTMYDHNFFTGEKMEFEIGFNTNKNSIAANRYGNYTAEVTYSLIRREDGVMVDQKVQNVNIKKGTEVFDKVVFEPTEYAVYDLKIEARNKQYGICSTETIGAAYIVKNEQINPKLGINISLINSNMDEIEKTADIILDSGFSSVRNCVVGYWQMAGYNAFYRLNNLPIQPTELGVPTAHARYIREMENRGISVLNFMGIYGNTNAQFEEAPRAANLAIPVTEAGLERLYQANLALIRETIGSKDEEYWFELGNEPDLAYPRNTVANAQEVARAYEYIVPRLKAIYPNLKIAGPVATSAGQNRAFTEAFLDIAADYIDGWSLHGYNHANNADGDSDPIWKNSMDYDYENMHNEKPALEETKDILEEYGLGDIPIWSTEYSLNAYTNSVYGVYEQARHNMIDVIQHYVKDYCDLTYIFQLTQNKTDRGNGEQNFGAVDEFGVAKPKLVACSAYNSIFYDCEFVSRSDLQWQKTNAFRYKKKTTGEDVLLFHSMKEREKISVDLGTNEVVHYDFYGNPTRLVSDDGTYTFTVDDATNYIVGKFTKCEFIESASVGVENVLFAPSKNVSIKVYNNTDENLKVEAFPNASTDTKVTEITEFENGEATVKIEMGNVPVFGREPIRIKVSGDKGTYFDDLVTVSYRMKMANIDRNTKRLEDGSWVIDFIITNPTEGQVQGDFAITSPEIWKTEIKDMILAPGESYVHSMTVPEGTDLGRTTMAATQFIINDAGDGTYEVLPCSFALAKKVTSSNPVKIDGEFDDWENAGWLSMSSFEDWIPWMGYNNAYAGYEDLHAKVAYKWDDENLYVAVETYDNKILNTAAETMIWSQDAVQLGVRYDPGTECQGKAHEEINMAYQDGKIVINRTTTYSVNRGARDPFENYDIVIKKDGDHILRYELRISWDDVTPPERSLEGRRPKLGDIVRIGCLIPDDDGDGRKGFLVQGENSVDAKDATKATPVYLID